jgi:hypothetical protein
MRMKTAFPVPLRTGALTGILTGVVAILLCTAAAAQQPGGQQGNALPFSSTNRRPSMSPYTALGFQGNNPATGGTLGAMQGLVRPQQQQWQQQQAALRQGRQINQLQRQAKQPRLTGAASIETIRATGHASTYMNLSHFYPAAR